MTRALTISLVLLLLVGAAAAQCALPTTSKTVNICSPASGATVSSPVQITASGYDASAQITSMAVYVDYTKTYTTGTNQVSTSQSLAAGSHHLTVKAWDAAGAVFSASENFTVGTSTPASCTATGANRTVTICTPANNSTVTSPVHITAAAADTASVSSLQIYVDGTKVYQVAGKSLDTSLAIADGVHKITVKAWDATGAFSSVVYISVGSSTTPAPTVTMTANPASISPGQSSTLTISAQNASSVVVTNNQDTSSTTLSSTGGTMTVTPTVTTTYTATATNSAGTKATANATVTVSTSTGGTGDMSAVKHIILYSHENRSFDSYFGMINEYRQAHGYTTTPDGHSYTVDGIDDKLNTITNPTDDGQNLFLFHTSSSCIDDLTSAWLESYGFVNRWNFSTSRGIKMDGYVHVAESVTKLKIGSGTFTDTIGERAMAYYKDTSTTGAPELNYYYYMASQFALSDRWFSPVASKTIPNRLATMTGGTTLGYTHDPQNDDNTGQLTAMTIFQLLEQHGISWKIYYEQTNSDGTPTTEFSRFTYANNFIKKTSTGVWMDPAHIAPISQYFTDVQNGTLPSFAFINKADGTDEHPGSGTSILSGQQQTAKLINALMYSPSWKDSVFFFTFDEAGGPYDHVPPVPGHTNDFTDPALAQMEEDVTPIAVNPDGYRPCLPTTSGVYNNHCDLRSADPGAKSTDAAAVYGFAAQIGGRVPNFVVSPFVKPHYVGHRAMDHTAVIRFVERRFGLPAMTNRDAAQPDLMDFFDFANPAWATPPSWVPTPPSVGSTCHADQMH